MSDVITTKQNSKVRNKVVVLVQEDPSYAMFAEVSKLLVADAIDPLNFISPESHMLAEVYKEIFKDPLANQLMGYLVSRQPTLLVWDIIGAVHESNNELILVNATLLTEEDVKFFFDAIDNVVTYNLSGKPSIMAGNIYAEVKELRDSLLPSEL